MRKSLFLGAIALMASSGAASAFQSIVQLDGFCNQYQMRYNTTIIATLDKGCSAGFGGGLMVKIAREGTRAMVALQDPTSSHTNFLFKFSYPFVTGGSWSLYSNNDGIHTNLLQSGTYTVNPSTLVTLNSKNKESVTAPLE